VKQRGRSIQKQEGACGSEEKSCPEARESGGLRGDFPLLGVVNREKPTTEGEKRDI